MGAKEVFERESASAQAWQSHRIGNKGMVVYEGTSLT